jgi:hypothetical protein
MVAVAVAPRWGWTPKWVSWSVLQTWTYCHWPFTRTGVSSACSTAAPWSLPLVHASVSSRAAAQRCTRLTTVPTESGQPITSESTARTRAKGTNCSCNRYTANARTSGPYCAGASTPTGKTAGVRV